MCVSGGDWIALVEMKCYGGGAKSRGLQLITGVTAMFSASMSRVPDAIHDVVNAFRERDAAHRSLALIGSEEDLVAFDENRNDYLVGTRDLFRLHRRYFGGQISASDVRAEQKAASAS